MKGLKTVKELLKDEKKYLAPYAMASSLSAGRVHTETADNYRLPFQQDRDRVIHCKAFRRLQAKTQVFVSYFGDHFRDRLTHSIEVAQIARDISRTLGLNEDLAEVLSLAHDLGHPPFGHGGEYALDEVMEKFNLHFEHNEQSRRIIETLEKIYPSFDGLNPTKEVLDGLLKHNPHSYTTYIDFEISPHLESQVMDLSDEIAYLNHDIDDGLRSEIINFKDISDFRIWKEAEKMVTAKYGRNIVNNAESRSRYKSRVISKMISRMIHDLCETTRKNLQKYKITDLSKVRKCKVKLVQFSPQMQKQITQLRAFLLKDFYLNPKVNHQIEKGKKIIKKLFLYYINNPGALPEPFQVSLKKGEALPVVVKDYIAGMTDHYAEETLEKLRIKN